MEHQGIQSTNRPIRASYDFVVAVGWCLLCSVLHKQEGDSRGYSRRNSHCIVRILDSIKEIILVVTITTLQPKELPLILLGVF